MMASMPFSGALPWELFPLTVRNSRSEEAIIWPSRTATWPRGRAGQTCWPNMASTLGLSSTPSSIIFLAPLLAAFSSEGWNTSLTVPGKVSFSSLST